MATTTEKTTLASYGMLAPRASVRVSPLCLGAMTFGEVNQERYGKITKREAFDMMTTFYENGGNFIDTANAYQAGQSEEWIGEWMQQQGNRSEMVLATKYTTSQTVLSTNAPGGKTPRIQANFTGNGVKNMKQAIDASLKRLQTDYIDLYYVHWWDYATSIPEVMHGLNDLVVAGKIHYLGISDTPAWIVSKANQYARDHGLRQFVVYQGMWNAGMRDFERDIIPMCISEGMGLCPYGVLGQGRFQTKEGFREREKAPEGRKFIPISEHDRSTSAHLEAIAERKGCQLLDVALQYCRMKTPYVYPIVGGRKVSHLEGNMKALEVQLSDEDLLEIEKGYYFDPGFPHTFLSGTLFKGHGTPQTAAYHARDVFLSKSLGRTDYPLEERPIRPLSKPADT